MVMSTANTRFGAHRDIHNPAHFAKNVCDVTGEGLGRLLPPKMFAQPFRLVFKRHRTEVEKKLGKTSADVSWIEIRSLGGLRNVVEKIEKGELEEIDRFSSLEMQLWGHLAEHSGFLRVQGSASTLAAGIQPLGEEPAALAEDFASIMGGTDVDALNILSEMKETLKGKPIDRTPMEQQPVTNEFVKPDGVNYTPAGEDALRQLILGNKNPTLCPPGEKATEFQKTAENAVQIFRETPEPTAQELAAEIQERIDCEIAGEGGGCEKNAIPPSGPVKTGDAAVMAGRLVADTARGLDNEQDAKVQEFATRAAELALSDETISEITIEDVEAVMSKDKDVHVSYGGKFDPHPDADPKDRVPGLEDFNVSMGELKELAGGDSRPDPMAKSKIGTAEALKAQDDNLKDVMKISEVDLSMMVEQSNIEELDPDALSQHQRMVDDLARRRRDAVFNGIKLEDSPGQTYGANHYAPRDVKPASDVPTDQDARAKWLEDRKSNDQGTDEK